jgi:hypothetical protein
MMSTGDIVVYKLTKDDWHPPFQVDGENAVSVSFLRLNPEGSEWRVCAWGADDFGVEKDFTNWSLAYEEFILAISQGYLSKDYLWERGWVPA